jgi:hypothetical protein
MSNLQACALGSVDLSRVGNFFAKENKQNLPTEHAKRNGATREPQAFPVVGVPLTW